MAEGEDGALHRGHADLEGHDSFLVVLLTRIEAAALQANTGAGQSKNDSGSGGSVAAHARARAQGVQWDKECTAGFYPTQSVCIVVAFNGVACFMPFDFLKSLSSFSRWHNKPRTTHFAGLITTPYVP